MIKAWSYIEEYKGLRKKILKTIDRTLKSGQIFFGKELQKYRLNRGFTQKDLATKLSIPIKDINEIESGKAKHNGPLMGKIKRIMK